MDINQAATFLTASILTGLGFIVVAGTIIILNNLFSKYWKPVKWSLIPDYDNMSPRFIEPHELHKEETK